MACTCIAVGDGIGDTDAALVRRTCRSDGVLLKTDRPAFAIDATWLQEAFGRGGPAGEVTATYTQIGAQRWRFVLGVALEAAYEGVTSAHKISIRVNASLPAGLLFQPTIDGVRHALTPSLAC